MKNRPTSKRQDRKVVRNTANKTKTININGGAGRRGGIRL